MLGTQTEGSLILTPTKTSNFEQLVGKVKTAGCNTQKNSFYYPLMAALTKAVFYVIKFFNCLNLGLERQERRQGQNQGEKRKA